MENNRFLNALGGLSELRWLKAIRDSLMLLLPVVFVGAIAILLGSFPYAVFFPDLQLSFAPGIQALLMRAFQASNGTVSLCLVVLVSHSLAVQARNHHGMDLSPAMAAIVGLVNFFIIVRFFDPASGTWILGPHNVLPAILVAIFSTEFLILFTRLTTPASGRKTYDLDPSLHLALNAIGPVVLTASLFVLASKGISLLSFDLGIAIRDSVASLNEFSGSKMPGLLVLGLLNQLLWFFGIHGWNILESIYPVLFTGPGDPQQVVDVALSFLSFYAHIGGAGTTLGLLIAIQIHARHGEAQRIARFALIPSLFNINELVIFGLPIIFNPAYLIPFVLAPLAQTAISYLCVQSGWLVIDVNPVPWTTPPILSGILNSGSWHGGALQLFNIALSTLIYSPFVRIAERRRRTENLKHMHQMIVDIGTLKLQQANVLDRHDEVGQAARKLLHEFLNDLGSERVYLAYQPQHDRSGRATGVEALLRWQHSRFGLISPAVVCALLEEGGQIVPFGRWTISEACAQLQRWKLAGVRNLRMSINLSPLQLHDATLLAHVEDSLAANMLLAREIGLELTESQNVPDDPVSTRTLKDLEALGIHLEMDDFGMGFSSMLYLRRFRFSAIKLDGVLTREVLQDKNCRDIIASVVQLGGASGIRVVAEYVETREQQALLEQLGCDEFQGYLYSPALIAPECLSYLLNPGFTHATESARSTSGSPRVAVVSLENS